MNLSSLSFQMLLQSFNCPQVTMDLLDTIKNPRLKNRVVSFISPKYSSAKDPKRKSSSIGCVRLQREELMSFY